MTTSQLHTPPKSQASHVRKQIPLTRLVNCSDRQLHLLRTQPLTSTVRRHYKTPCNPSIRLSQDCHMQSPKLLGLLSGLATCLASEQHSDRYASRDENISLPSRQRAKAQARKPPGTASVPQTHAQT